MRMTFENRASLAWLLQTKSAKSFNGISLVFTRAVRFLWHIYDVHRSSSRLQLSWKWNEVACFSCTPFVDCCGSRVWPVSYDGMLKLTSFLFVWVNTCLFSCRMLVRKPKSLTIRLCFHSLLFSSASSFSLSRSFHASPASLSYSLRLVLHLGSKPTVFYWKTLIISSPSTTSIHFSPLFLMNSLSSLLILVFFLSIPMSLIQSSPSHRPGAFRLMLG